jgi:threonine synthase
MKFVCTKNDVLITNLEGALFHPIPLKDCLWVPYKLNKLPDSFFNNIDNMSFKEISYIVAENLIGSEIPKDKLKNIIDECFNFKIPLHRLTDNFHILELFHGPTMTFKDVGARFM